MSIVSDAFASCMLYTFPWDGFAWFGQHYYAWDTINYYIANESQNIFWNKNVKNWFLCLRFMIVYINCAAHT